MDIQRTNISNKINWSIGQTKALDGGDNTKKKKKIQYLYSKNVIKI